jgi:plasmid stability protein
MTALTLKNIPERLYLALKTAAQRDHRSLNAQVIYCLEQALVASESPLSPEKRLDRFRALRPTIPPLTTEEIGEAIDKGRL